MKNINRFYKVNKGHIVFPSVEREKLTVGEIYNISSGLITDGFYGNNHQLYFYEYSKPGDNVFIMTDRKGMKPFAVATNDCLRDNFPDHCLAKVLIEEGNHIIYSYPDTDSSKKFNGMHNIAIFKIVQLSPAINHTVNPELSINVALINKYSIASHHDVPNFKDAIRHTLLVSRRKTDDYTTPKYCFNPGRIVLNRLFHREDEGEMVSYNDQGRRLVLNRNSKEDMIENNKGLPTPASNLFMRCFYSKKHSNEETIFVDGAKLTMLREEDLQDYIEKSDLTDTAASSIIKKAVTLHGQAFFVVVNIKGEIRPIYTNSYGYATFPLGDKEREFIDQLIDLDLEN